MDNWQYFLKFIIHSISTSFVNCWQFEARADIGALGSILAARRSVTKFSHKIDLELNFAFQGFPPPPRILSFLHEYFRWNFNVDIYLPLKRYKKNFQLNKLAHHQALPPAPSRLLTCPQCSNHKGNQLFKMHCKIPYPPLKKVLFLE